MKRRRSDYMLIEGCTLGAVREAMKEHQIPLTPQNEEKCAAWVLTMMACGRDQALEEFQFQVEGLEGV